MCRSMSGGFRPRPPARAARFASRSRRSQSKWRARAASCKKRFSTRAEWPAPPATGHAGRAGAAGRGCAIVASEVKDLARQTAGATGEIRRRITAVQQATGEAVGAVGAIASRIESMGALGGAMAAAVASGSDVAQSIVRDVGRSAEARATVETHLGEVRLAAREAGEVSREVLRAATELAGRADDLSADVGAFIADMRNADASCAATEGALRRAA